MNEEAQITVNGVELSSGQAMVVRVALSAFLMHLQEDGLGQDELGHELASAYRARASEVLKALLRGRSGGH